jgi:hypothetical protein
MTTKIIDKPAVMTLSAQAVWNEEKGVWDVSLKQTIVAPNLADETMCAIIEDTQQIEECDDCVFVMAVARMNGWDV